MGKTRRARSSDWGWWRWDGSLGQAKLLMPDSTGSGKPSKDPQDKCTCVHTPSDVNIRVHPPCVLIDGHTQAHPPPHGNTDSSTPAARLHVHPPSTMHSKSAFHQEMTTPGDSRLQKKTGSFPRLMPGEERGARQSGRGRSREQRPSAPCLFAIRPHRGCRSDAP